VRDALHAFLCLVGQPGYALDNLRLRETDRVHAQTGR